MALESGAKEQLELSESKASQGAVDTSQNPFHRHRYWPIAAALGVLLAFGYFGFKRFQNGAGPTSVAGEQRQRLEAELARLNQWDSVIQPTVVASLAPQPLTLRTPGNVARIEIPNPDTIIGLNLELGNETHNTYVVVIQNAEGIDLARIENLKPNAVGGAKVILLKLSSSHLEPGIYKVILAGLSPSGKYEDVGIYPFRLVKS